ncbi:MAG: ABC transporter permease [Armatimonadetes bacterium]|nr:ABC transporter permease [Armatimonadota bacterium]
MIIWSIAKTTIGDALRKKVLQIFLVVAIGLIIISLSFSQTLSFSSRAGSSTDIMLVKSFGLGLMAVAAWLISLVMGVSLIPQEIERRTIYTILSKPVKRYEFIVGKFLGAFLTLAINVAVMGVVFIAVCVFKAWGAEQPLAREESGIPVVGMQQVGLWDWNMVWGVIMIYFQFLLLSSVVLFLSVVLTPTVNFFMGLGVYIVGVMAPLTETLASPDAKLHVVLKTFYKVLHIIVPNFDKFNITNPLLHPETQVKSIPMYTGIVTLYAILYALVMMLLAVIVFRRKEV